MKHFRVFFVLLLLALFSTTLHAQTRLCVLGFEKRDFPASLGLQKVFSKHQSVHLVIEATPQDLLFCLRQGYEEILFVAHALIINQESEAVNLGYFKEMTGAEREAFIEASLQQVQTRLKGKELERTLKKIKNFPATKPIYGSPYVIMNRFFQSMEKDIQELSRTQKLKLKKFRLMTCESQKILQRYPFFNNLAGYGVELDVAPTSKVGSWLYGKQVTNFNFGWVKKSLKP